MKIKTYTKTLLSLFLAIMIMISVFSAELSVQAAETDKIISNDIKSGTIGECEWEYNSALSSMVISGIGSMETKTSASEYPWYGLDIKSLTIQEGVTSISAYAFEKINITSLQLPKSLTTIQNYAFSGCAFLESIEIPESVISLGESVFSDCAALKSAVLPDKLTAIPDGFFSSCVSLESINISSTVTKIGNAAFYDCESLKSVVIPSSVKTIERSAFRLCDKLASITFPSALYDIKPGALSDTAWLNNKPAGVVYINNMAYTYNGSPASVTIKKNTSKICAEAFDGCTSIKTLTIKSGVKEIEDLAFYNCPNLSSVSIPDTVKTIGVEAFSENTSLKKLTIPSSVTSIGSHAYGYTFYYDSNTDVEEYRRISGSKIYGAIGSQAFKYAFDSSVVNKYGIAFHTNMYIKKTAKIKGTFQENTKLTYNSSNKNIASVSSAGKVTAVKKGTATITVSQNGKSWSFKVHVKKPKLNASKKTLKKGKTFKLKITGQIGKAKFSSSNKKVASVTKKGKIKAKKKGKATITVQTNGIKLKCKVTVKKK